MTRQPTLHLLLAAGLTLGLRTIPAAEQQQPPTQPGTKWTDAQLRETVDLARAGRKLTPKSWPKGARVAVCLSFDVDTEAPHLRDGTTSPTALSAAEFGAQSGTPRILAMLDRHQIPATFFITGVDAMLHPDMLAAIQKSGRHEIGVHGWIHETPTRITADEEERLLDKAIDYLTKVTGKRPVGYRAPSWAFSSATLDLIQKKGFHYDSSLQAMDEPYEIISRGRPTGLVELAIDWTLTETPFLGAQGRMPLPEQLYKLYREEFDGAYEERTMFVLTLHPYLSGHRSPMQHLEKFVAYMKSKPGVWFATAAEIAQYVREQAGLKPPAPTPPAVVPSKVTPLFNGRDLTGWTADVPAKDKDSSAPASFIVRNGLLVSL
jgi:peptidoglycan/xylan/chitin deacetylase (PgdA/CDA1 family)